MAKQNLTVYRGTSIAMTYTHTSAMTGGTVYFTVKSSTYDTDLTDASATPQATITSFTNGDTKASWTLSDEDMYIDPGNYFYDIVVEDASGNSLPPIFEGKFKVLPHTTNRNVPV